MVVPTMLARIVDYIETHDIGGIPTLRALSYGGGKMPLPVIEKALDMMPNCRVRQCVRAHRDELDGVHPRSRRPSHRACRH